MVLAQSYSFSLEGPAAAALIIGLLAVSVFVLAAYWRVFSKAGQPGWAVIIPIYNIIVLLRVAGRPWWWLFVLLIPIIPAIIVSIDVAKSFGKGAGFGFGLFLLPIIFWPILGFGSARYVGPAAASR